MFLKLTEFASELVAKNNFIKVSFGGFAGAGKTQTASSFVAGSYIDLKLQAPIMLIDNEKGARFLMPYFEKNGIKIFVKNTFHLADVLDAFHYLNTGEVDYIFIDSLTKIWYQFIIDYKDRLHRNFLTMKDWANIIPEWQEKFNNVLVDADGCVVFTGRGGYKYDLEEIEQDNGKTKKEFVQSGVKFKLSGETPYEPDMNIWMSTEQKIENGNIVQWYTAMIMKDRSGLINGKTFINPTYNDFKPVVDFLMGLKTGDVAGATNTTNLIPSDEGQLYYRNKRILVEEIEGVLENTFPGTSKEMKIAKCALKKGCLGTYSDTAIEALCLDELLIGKEKIEEILRTGYSSWYSSWIIENSKTSESNLKVLQA